MAMSGPDIESFAFGYLTIRDFLVHFGIVLDEVQAFHRP